MNMSHENLFLRGQRFAEETKSILSCCSRNVRIKLSGKSLYQRDNIATPLLHPTPLPLSPASSPVFKLVKLTLLLCQIHNVTMQSALKDP